MGIYDYLQYQYAHNSNIHRALANDSTFTGAYDKVRTLADEQAWYLYGNTSSSSTDADNQAITGKTLAASIL
jgi:chromosome condensin MukBEF MukE localization factor